MRIIITLALLFSFAFSSVHEFAFAIYDENPCSVSEYVDEIQSPNSHHDDICDTHFEYHHAFLLPSEIVLARTNKMTRKPNFYKEEYKFLADLDYPKPPIS